MNTANYQPARVKALQQLAVSDDSPFNLNAQEEAHRLRDETEEIKRQLDLVKSQINELSQQQPKEGHRQAASSACCQHKWDSHKQQQQRQQDEDQAPESLDAQAPRVVAGERRHEFVNNQQVTSADNQFHAQFASETRSSNEDRTGQISVSHGAHDVNPKLRPLTGKTDCPNCACDRRRSVCDNCMELQQHRVVQAQEIDKAQTLKRAPTFITEQQISTLMKSADSHQHPEQSQQQVDQTAVKEGSNFRDFDERPIRPAKQNFEDILRHSQACTTKTGAVLHDEQTLEKTSVDKVVVPGKLYTISRSLNDKRTKLAQAIEELQLTIDKVKKRGERLERERKVAQLYKGQWKFGPAIGGSGSLTSLAGTGGRRGSLESLRGGVASQYKSRLDPNLARDSNSMMGFQNVEPSIRHLRQYASTTHLTHNKLPAGARQHQQTAPRPKPRLSKLNGAPLAAASNLYSRPTQASSLHARSRSIESLHTRAKDANIASMSGQKEKTTASAVARQTPKPSRGSNAQTKHVSPNFDKGKSSSDINMAPRSASSDRSLSGDDDNSSAAVEEELEQDEIREDDETPENQGQTSGHEEPLLSSGGRGNPSKTTPEAPSHSNDDNLRTDSTRGLTGVGSPVDNQDYGQHENGQQKLPTQESRRKVWIPVFGETEVKTIDRRPTVRKVQEFPDATRVEPALAGGKSILRTSNKQAANISNRGRGRGAANDRVLHEATKRLQFASDLLEHERRDSLTTNQLVVMNKTRPTASPRLRQPSTQPVVAQRRQMQRRPRSTGGVATGTMNGKLSGTAAGAITRDAVDGTVPSAPAVDDQTVARSVIVGANREIARLEEMISEQQALLVKLTQTSAQSPAPTCCHHRQGEPCAGQAQTSSANAQARHQQHAPSRQLIGNLRDRLNKTKARLARTLEEERAKHQLLEQKVDSSLRKQSDLENENELLKKSLSKCIDTCLRDISSTFESLSDTLGESIETDSNNNNNHNDSQALTNGLKLDCCPDQLSGALPRADSGSVSPLLSNAAQLIVDNRHLKRMKSHIDTIERQRRAIFEELNEEKHRSKQLEEELGESRLQLEQLIEAKQRLERQLTAANSTVTSDTPAASHLLATNSTLEQQPRPSTPRQDDNSGRQAQVMGDEMIVISDQAHAAARPVVVSPRQQQSYGTESNSCSLPTTSSASTAEDDMTSIETYHHYIQSMTPDLDAIRRERRMILDEFDTIKKMLSDMDNN